MVQTENLYDVVVIGGGPAGLTAALYLARARYRVVVVEKDHFGGQITITSELFNFPGVERTSGAALTESMRKQAESFGAEFLLAEVTGLDLTGDVKTVRTSRCDLKCFGVLLATGAHPRMVGFQGEEQFRGRGVGFHLLTALCNAADASGYWTLQSTVLQDNEASRRLHAKCGFRLVGRRERIARDCRGHWLDTYLMERRAAADEPEGFKKL